MNKTIGLILCLLSSIVWAGDHQEDNPVTEFFRPVAEALEKPRVGPPSGTLIAQGGGWPFDPKFVERFISEAGGPDKKFVLVTSALPYSALKKPKTWAFIRSWLDARGVKDVSFIPGADIRVPGEDALVAKLKAMGKTDVEIEDILQQKYSEHLRKLSNEGAFKKLAEADGVFFWGGRQWRFVDAFLDTPFVDDLEKVLKKDGVIAGSSAGASIQGSYLARGDQDSKHQIVSDDPPEKKHDQGFSFLAKTAVDQHAFERGRLFEMFEILEKHPDHLGLSLAEDSALVIKNDYAEVIGGPVAVYDGSQLFPGRGPFGLERKPIPPGKERFYTISEGQVYDLRWRRDVRLSPRPAIEAFNTLKSTYHRLTGPQSPFSR